MRNLYKVFYVFVFIALISFVSGFAIAGENTKININTATKEELSSLKGIGKIKAETIVAYRENHGHFTKIEDIKNVKGIGDKIFEKIKNHIRVE
ncbi:MAG: ComEA family DNA-binding protein [Candidatus Scalinduaceae bacterium]